MKSELMMDLCFIRKCAADSSEQNFEQLIDDQLKSLFSKKMKWNIEHKQANDLDIVNVEIKGFGTWKRDEEIIAYLEERAQPHFWDWLQGYRIQIEVKEEHAECSHCGKNNAAAEVS